MTWQVLHGDCIERLAGLDESSVDAIVTDPPYGLGFMGKEWDDLPPGLEFAEQALRVLKPGGHLLAFGGSRTYHRLACAVEDAGFEIRDQMMWLYGSGFPKSLNLSGDYEGLGTALKPAHEPIVIARKPLLGTVLENVLAYGTGALNIDHCRVEEERWPANLVLDEQGGRLLDAQTGEPYSRFFYCAKPTKGERNLGLGALPKRVTNQASPPGTKGSRSPRAGANRNGASANHHPTVKPIELMRYLCRLVTPPGGTVLDPFLGSGTTGCAAVLEGFDFIGIEREPEYVAICEARIAWWEKHRGEGLTDDVLKAAGVREEAEQLGQLGLLEEAA